MPYTFALFLHTLFNLTSPSFQDRAVRRGQGNNASPGRIQIYRLARDT